MHTDISTIINAIYLCSAMVLFLCVSGAVILFKRWDGRRARVYLGVVLLLLSVPYVGFLLEYILDPHFEYKHYILQPLMLTGYLAISLLLLPYCLELVNPEWRHERSLPKRLAPAIVFFLLMWIAWFLQPVYLANTGDYWRNYFRWSVLTRTIVLLVPIGYMVKCAWEVWNVDCRWREWSSERGVDTPRATAWIWMCFAGMATVMAALVLVLFTTDAVYFLLFNILFILFLSYIVYKAIFADSVYPDSFFCCSEEEDAQVDDLDGAFESRIPGYVEVIRKWFEEDKPYLDSHFKLENVRDKVPMNRTYLSRIFNEGFGESFSDHIRALRMQEARRLLAEEPEMGIGEVAERCGFSTHSSFHRSFMQKNEGLTPGEYRQLVLSRNKNG